MEIKKLTRQAIVAAVYVAISLLLAPVSYGAVQLRLAETLKVLPYYNRRYTVGVTLGCLIVNMFSPMGLTDVVFGTLATFITCELASRVKRTIYIAPVTAIVTGIIVGAELHVVLGLPFLPSVITVTAGEFLAVLAGVVIAGALNKNDAVRALLRND